jgi:ribosomal protein S18 acetylase RimI-like enzyme
MAMWRIRQAGPEDHDAVLALWREVDLGQTEEDEWKAITEGPAATLLLAEDEGTLLGTAVAAFDGWRAYIYHVAVAPPYRQRGLAKALMAEAEEHLRRKGARRVYVLVHETNTAGLALAAAMGYQLVGDLGFVKELVPSSVTPSP